MKAGSNSSAGLTLLETILAISMLGMILTALHVALSSGVGAYRRCRDTSDRDTTAYAAIRLISDDLQRLALPVAAAEPPTLLGMPEVGRPGGCLLRLRTNARPGPDAREMLVDYFFMPTSSEAGSLVRRSEPLHAPGWEGQGPPSGQGADDTEARYEGVAVGLRGVRLRYFDGEAWSDQWSTAERSGPPKLVEVVLEFAGKGGRARTYTQAVPVVVESPLIGRAGEENP